MFRPDPTLSHVRATRDQVVAVIESINQPQISIPTKAPQAAQAHLVGIRNAGGTFTLYVGLYLCASGENVVYRHDRSEVPVDGYRDQEAEGLHFLESMGFMLDNAHFNKLAPEAQEQLLQRVPLLHAPRPRAASASEEAKARPRQALARMLAGF